MSDDKRTDEHELPVDETGTEDFDAFWRDREASGVRKRKRTTVMGELVTLPASIPILFDLEAKRLKRSKRLEDMKKLTAILFGENAMERFADKGMDAEQFAVLIAWAPQVIAGNDVTLAEVAAELDAMGAKRGDKDPS